MRDVALRTSRAELMGRNAAMPLCVAPTALQRMAHPDGELATARAALSAAATLVHTPFTPRSPRPGSSTSTGIS